jgi:hypothetical protein
MDGSCPLISVRRAMWVRCAPPVPMGGCLIQTTPGVQPASWALRRAALSSWLSLQVKPFKERDTYKNIRCAHGSNIFTLGVFTLKDVILRTWT